jgi:K+-sensing histidine kinase KdpD
MQPTKKAAPAEKRRSVTCKETYMKIRMHKKLSIVLGVVFFVCILWWLDVWTGYEFDFFIFYFFPVSIIAWFFGVNLSIICSILCALVWFSADYASGHTYSAHFIAVWNTLICLISFSAVGWGIGRIHVLLQSEKVKTENLERALSEIKILESFLSICSVCKKIRNEDGKWQQIESYISTHSETKFSHGYCPECAKKAIEEAELFKK